jgi:hypothetical protein
VYNGSVFILSQVFSNFFWVKRPLFPMLCFHDLLESTQHASLYGL